MMGGAGTILAALWRMGSRKAGVAAGKQKGMVVAGVMERNGGTEIEIGGRTGRLLVADVGHEGGQRVTGDS